MSDSNSSPPPPVLINLNSSENKFEINQNTENQPLDFPHLLNLRLNFEVKNAIKTAVENEPSQPIPNLDNQVPNLDAQFPNLDAPFSNLDVKFPNLAAKFPNLDTEFPTLDSQPEPVVENCAAVENEIIDSKIEDQNDQNKEISFPNGNSENPFPALDSQSEPIVEKCAAAENEIDKNIDQQDEEINFPKQNNDNEEVFSLEKKESDKPNNKRPRTPTSSDEENSQCENKRIHSDTARKLKKKLRKKLTIAELKKIIRDLLVYKTKACCECPKLQAELEKKFATLLEKYKQLVKIVVRLSERLTELGRSRPSVSSVGIQCKLDDEVLSAVLIRGGENSSDAACSSTSINGMVNDEIVLDDNFATATTSKACLMSYSNNVANPMSNSMSPQFRIVTSNHNQRSPLNRAPQPRAPISTGFTIAPVNQTNGHVVPAVPPRHSPRNYGLPKPTLSWSRFQGLAIQLMWDHEATPLFRIAMYHLFAYQKDSDRWKQIGEVVPLPLPMACTLTELNAREPYYFAICAVDDQGRVGPMSHACEIRL